MRRSRVVFLVVKAAAIIGYLAFWWWIADTFWAL